MSISKKIFLRVIPVVLVLIFIISTNVFGWSSFDVTDKDSSINKINESNLTVGKADTAVNRVWGTVTLVLQILAIAAIVVAGVRYMFASADGKADIKKQTIGLVVGAILVFAASTVVGFIVNVTQEVVK